ncbi:MAG: hypothetical protein NTX97_07870 [Bacteroidetes bacterium]|nr:hypothetical protein [Bacteroidota bacterium]
MNSFINKIDRLGCFLEQKIGLFFTSLLLACALLMIAMIYVAPNFEMLYHGEYFSRLSLNPFNLSDPNPVRYRILGPLIGYITHLKGPLFVYVPLIFARLFLAAVYSHYRQHKFTVSEAFIFAGIISFSCTILIPIKAAGYTDTITYYFLFLAFSKIKREGLSAFYFGLAMLNHECSIFLLPGLIVYYNYKNDKNIFAINKIILYYLLALFPFFIYRYYISNNAIVDFSLKFYFSKDTIEHNFMVILPLIPAGLFFAFKLFWLYPTLMIVENIKTRSYKSTIVVLAIIIPVIVQLIIAYDVTRMLCLLFPAILISAEVFRERKGTGKFTRIGLWLLLLNFLVLQYFVSSYSIHPLLPIFME